MESIRILQNTYERLFVLAKPVAIFLENNLPLISSQWKYECIDEVLKTEYKDGTVNYLNRNLKELDIYYLLKVLLDNHNWNLLKNLTPINPFFSETNNELLKDVREIRNTISHPQIRDFSLSEYKIWIATLEAAARLFDSDLNILLDELHNNEKQRLLTMITSKVINPALACPNLDSEIKERIKGTQDRLEVQNTASGIISFFEDALRARGGKQIKEQLHHHSLIAFEDIADEVFESYYGK